MLKRRARAVADPVSDELKKQMMKALSEGSTVLVRGIVPHAEGFADMVCIYRLKDEKHKYQGWVYMRGHSNASWNGMFYRGEIDTYFVKNDPHFVSIFSVVEGLAEEDMRGEAAVAIALALEPEPEKGKGN